MDKKKPIPFTPEKMMEMICYAVYQLSEDEGHSDYWVKGLLDVTDEEFQFVLDYLASMKND